MLAQVIKKLSDHIISCIPNATRHIGFLNSNNSYPCFSILSSSQENISHALTNNRIREFKLLVRGFNNTGSIGYALTALDEFIKELEQAINSFSFVGSASETNITYNGITYSVYDVRIVEISSDEGLFEPLGIADLQVVINYA